jgi:nicotinamidase-related amidase
VVTPACSIIVLAAGMTIRKARGAFAAAWTGLDIEFFVPGPAFDKDAFPGASEGTWTRESDVLTPRKGGTDTVVITGGMDPSSVRDAIREAFGLEAEVSYVVGILKGQVGGTLDQQRDKVAAMIAGYKAKYGRAPGADARFHELEQFL